MYDVLLEDVMLPPCGPTCKFTFHWFDINNKHIKTIRSQSRFIINWLGIRLCVVLICSVLLLSVCLCLQIFHITMKQQRQGHKQHSWYERSVLWTLVDTIHYSCAVILQKLLLGINNPQCCQCCRHDIRVFWWFHACWFDYICSRMIS